MNMRDGRGHWALVTGASSGIGREFCGQLAANGMNVVLVARRQQRLEDEAARLRAAHGIATLVVPVDLCRDDAAVRIREDVERQKIRIRLLCNCAGQWRWGRFEESGLDSHEEMIRVNVLAPVALCRLFFDHLVSFPSSAIVNVGSPAAFQPIPYVAAYAASKAFLHSFSLALYGEWRKKGVRVHTLAPGPTDTEFDGPRREAATLFPDRISPAEVVGKALARLGRDQPLVTVPNRFLAQRLFVALCPVRVMIRQVARRFRPPNECAPR